MKFPHNYFPLRWNDSWDEPEVDQAEYGNFRISWNPDDDRFYVARRNTEYPDDWDTLGTYKNTRKGYENAVQRMKREIRLSMGIFSERDIMERMRRSMTQDVTYTD